MKSAYQIIRRPVITEKGLGAKEAEGTLVFEVAAQATKTEVKEAVQTIFKVKVSSVRTANFPGKERRRGKFAGYRPDWKKAYVRLKAGEKILRGLERVKHQHCCSFVRSGRNFLMLDGAFERANLRNQDGFFVLKLGDRGGIHLSGLGMVKKEAPRHDRGEDHEDGEKSAGETDRGRG